jgi:hypothetical protein
MQMHTQGGSDNVTLTAVAVEVMRAGISAGIANGGAVTGDSERARNADASGSTDRGIFDELQSPAYGPLLQATQDMVHEAQIENSVHGEGYDLPGFVESFTGH